MGWLLSWGFFWLGDVVSKLMLSGWTIWLFYPFYNWCMTVSADLQDNWKVVHGPWSAGDA